MHYQQPDKQHIWTRWITVASATLRDAGGVVTWGDARNKMAVIPMCSYLCVAGRVAHCGYDLWY